MVRHALLLPLALVLGAAPVTPVAAAEPTLNIEYERFTLDNGLEVILAPRPAVPLVATNVWYHVGSGDETPGKSGFAHLFEHMMFQGAKHIGKDVHFNILQEIGGTSGQRHHQQPTAPTTSRSCRATRSRRRCGSRATAWATCSTCSTTRA
jgi:predicted Zn-dependent peptidase